LSHHSVIVLQYSAFIFGGNKPNGSQNLEIFKFECAINRWDIIKQNGTSPGGCDNHTANYYDEQMIIFGGFRNGTVRTNEIHKFKFSSNIWVKVEPVGPIPPARAGHTAVIYKDNLVIFSGTN
jgi:N-acetylneuraminic acid mutarotase